MAWIDGKLCEATERGYRQVRPLARNAKDGSVLVWVPGGEFEMGDGQDSGCPKHRVHVDGYYIGVYCVTNRQYGRFRDEVGGDRFSVVEGKEDHPVVNVSWDDAAGYAKWADCELPTEAQWEKAARGPLGLIYPWGEDWDETKCRNDKNKGSEQTAEVREYPGGTSGYGTYQQSGNVWEWCRDWYGDYDTGGVQRNPTGPQTGSGRVGRGGGWGLDGASIFRGAYRNGYLPGSRGVGQGFRLVRAV